MYRCLCLFDEGERRLHRSDDLVHLLVRHRVVERQGQDSGGNVVCDRQRGKVCLIVEVVLLGYVGEK